MQRWQHKKREVQKKVRKAKKESQNLRNKERSLMKRPSTKLGMKRIQIFMCHLK